MSDRNTPTKRYIRFHCTISRTPEPDKSPTLPQLIPPHWISLLDVRAVWMRGYRMMRVYPPTFEHGSPCIDIGMVRVLMLPGPVTYGNIDNARVFVPADNTLHFDVGRVGDIEAPGPCLLLITPFGQGSLEGDESKTSHLLDQTAALLVALHGLNIAHEFLFDNVHTLDRTKTEVWATSVQSPLWLPSPAVDKNSLNRLSAAGKAIAQHSESERSRIGLSLQWFHRASRLSGVEAFLSYWIAIESLVMRSHGDLISVKRAIERINSLSAQEAGQRFRVQSLYDIRGRIVHRGEFFSIQGELLEYVEALYTDLLIDKIGLPFEQRADKLIRASSTSLQELFPPRGR